MESHPLITDNRNQNIKFHFPTAAIEHQGCEEFLNYYVNGLEMKCMVTAFIPSLPRIDHHFTGHRIPPLAALYDLHIPE